MGFNYTIIRNDDYLCHDGRKGQKHGVQNGPPYPLNADQLSAEELKYGGVSPSAQEKYKNSGDTKKKDIPRELSKSETYDKGGVLAKGSDMYANRAMYTSKEIQSYLDRVRLENSLAELAQKEYKANHPVKTLIEDKKNDLMKKVINDTGDYFYKVMKEAIGVNVKQIVNTDNKSEKSNNKEKKKDK